ncbi:MAG TPA: hypothetical protein VKF15_03685 [Nitrososphaerales archaeon]|nr:hypothetical protein [Nitrososphaerales archaeon]
MIISVSGVRGILNVDMTLADVARFADNFGRVANATEVLLARDTRKTGPVISRAVVGALVGRGISVVDFGVISTPALFRESLTRGRPAVMVTASHNEPEYNGLKFIVDGKGIDRSSFDQVAGPARWELSPLRQGSVRRSMTTSYADDLVKRFGEGSCDGVKVALDLGGGAAITHAVPLLRRLGCLVTSMNDAPGVFSRRVDPTADELALLRRMVKTKECDVGLAFDCDGDRLVIVDDAGNKRTGDYMLTLALAQILAESKEKSVVVSVDTTQAVDIVAGEVGAKVLRSKVGEANVVSKMFENGARLGGEGSSGGLIDGSFNYCRDSLLAALTIIRALKRKGRKAYGEVKSFQQHRVAVALPQSKALRAIKVLAERSKGADTTDGVKIWLSKRSWVLIRASGTEDVVRVSAEAETASKASDATRAYSAKLKELCR